MPVNHVIILAAGQGQRFKSKQDKLLLPVLSHPLIYYTLLSFNDHPEIETITLVANKNNKSDFEKVIKDYRFKKVKKVIIGGLTRQKSFELGFQALAKVAKKDNVILVHNGDNPLVTHEEISKVIGLSADTGACIAGHSLTSTIKEIEDNHVIKTHDREKLFAAQTPQAAKFSIFEKALKNAETKNLEVTDEAMLLEAIGQKIAFVEASADNFKVTTQADYHKLKSILGDLPDDFRVGIGQDSHVFEEDIMGLVIGGITLNDYKKLQANSDGDVILHAVFNAISQAIGENSLGFYADEVCEKGVKDSKKYLEPLLKKLKKEKFRLNSLGIMIECKVPKIDPIGPQLKKSLSKILEIDGRRIGITATSGENLTAFGSGLGIQCFAIVSLVKI